MEQKNEVNQPNEKIIVKANFPLTKPQKAVINEMKKGCVLRFFVASRVIDQCFYLVNENAELINVNGHVGRNLIRSGLIELMGTTGKNRDFRLKTNAAY